MLFQPANEQDKFEDQVEYLVATVCSDNKFRLWINKSITGNDVLIHILMFIVSIISFIDIVNILGKNTAWNCHSIGYYKDHPLLDICFSSDGSLLGAAFGPCLTLWDTDTNEMKYSLAKGSQPLR